jgi:hypothetical protein
MSACAIGVVRIVVGPCGPSIRFHENALAVAGTSVFSTKGTWSFSRSESFITAFPQLTPRAGGTKILLQNVKVLFDFENSSLLRLSNHGRVWRRFTRLYDANAVTQSKTLQRQFGGKYDGRKVRNPAMTWKTQGFNGSAQAQRRGTNRLRP